MNALQRAKESLLELAQVLHLASQARMAATVHSTSKQAPPRATQLRVTGNAMVRVVDADTGKVLGFRRTIREARWLADALERGEYARPAQ
jgi:hypothetical protein